MDADAENLLDVLLKSDEVEQGPPRVELHEKVDITLESLVSASDGTE